MTEPLSWRQFRALSPRRRIDYLCDQPSDDRAKRIAKNIELCMDFWSPEERAEILHASGGWAALARRLLSLEPKITAPTVPPVWKHWADRVLDAAAGLGFRVTEPSIPSGVNQERAAALPSALGQASWSGSGYLSVSVLNTPYLDMIHYLSLLKLRPGSLVVDLGAGYGRMGLVVGHFFPQHRYQGFEIVAGRARAAQDAYRSTGVWRRAQVLHQDCAASTWEVPAADVYFLYDPFNQKTLEFILQKVRKNLEQKTEKKMHSSHVRILVRGTSGPVHSVLVKQGWIGTEIHPKISAIEWYEFRPQSLRQAKDRTPPVIATQGSNRTSTKNCP